MTQITARVPEELFERLDRAAKTLGWSRSDVIRGAIEKYLEDFEDLSKGLDRLRDPADPVLDWEVVRAELPAVPLCDPMFKPR